MKLFKNITNDDVSVLRRVAIVLAAVIMFSEGWSIYRETDPKATRFYECLSAYHPPIAQNYILSEITPLEVGKLRNCETETGHRFQARIWYQGHPIWPPAGRH